MTNKSYLISTIIPYYNTRFDLFTEAIESILSQSYTNWEAIIVNDGSTIQNKNLLEGYISKINDKRISILHLNKNFGPSFARNKGIETSKGEVITLLDSDDVFLPWYFQKIIDEFSKNPDLNIIVVNCLFYIRLGNIKKISTNKAFSDLLDNLETQEKLLETFKYRIEDLFPIVTFKKEVFNKIKFDPEITLNETLDFHLQILNNKELLNKTRVEPIAGYLYRIYPSRSRLTHQGKLKFEDIQKIITKYNKNSSSLGYKMVRHLQEQYGSWKYNEFLYNYLNNNSLIMYAKNTFLKSKFIKDKIHSIRTLIGTIITYKVLVPVFNINSRYLSLLSLATKNKYKQVKTMFSNYLNTIEDKNGKAYAIKTFKRTF